MDQANENVERIYGQLMHGKKYKDISKDGGVLKILLDPGVGDVVPRDNVVLLHYIGYISNISEPFDISYIQGKPPKRFNLGRGELLPGLELGIQTMTHGENARFIISPKYAYREMDCPSHIPPNSTVQFDVHLVSFFALINFPVCFDVNNKDPDKFFVNHTIIKKLHYKGNEQFILQNIERAILQYEKAKDLLLLTGYDNEDEEEMINYLNKLYSNLSICYLKLCAFNKVCRMGTEGMKYSERFSKNNVKLWFYWGKALIHLKEFTGGKEKLLTALKLEPQNITIQKELQRFEEDRKIHDRIDALVKYKDDDTERLSSEYWEIFNTLLDQFVGGSDNVLTVKLNDNSEDIELAVHKSNYHNLEFLRYHRDDNCFIIKKK